MKLENQCLVPADWNVTWNLLMDIPGAAALVPGVEEVSAEEENRFRATMRVRIGPIRLNFSGTIHLLEQDREKGEARFRVEAADRRVGGSFRADMTMRLNRHPQDQTGMSISTDVAFMGKLGELGQPLIRRKAASTLEDFARNLSKQVAGPSG